jgi:hypothetical protein
MGGQARKKSSVFEWHELFKQGHEKEENERRGHPSYYRTYENFEKRGTWYIQTVKKAYHVELLKRLHEAVRRKRPELWPNDWILHNDAPPHSL